MEHRMQTLYPWRSFGRLVVQMAAHRSVGLSDCEVPHRAKEVVCSGVFAFRTAPDLILSLLKST
eukprot:301472-Amphidinium_carterae.2